LKRFCVAFAVILITQAANAQVLSLKTQWKFHVGDNRLWSRADFNDASWETVRVPSAWEDNGFNGYDGFAWYRIRFDGKPLNRDNTYYLNMGYIDDTDETYLNGMMIGFSGQCPPKFKTAYNNERKYLIPTSLINYDGENIIAVRVFDVIHGGGIVDGEIGIYTLERDNRFLVDLQGVWLFSRSFHGEKIDHSDQWQNIMVPSAWEHQGLTKYDGFGWYKKTFSISSFPDEEIVLVLGKIDDFDKTYFNGRLIGQTNDGRPYGYSGSYVQERVYTLPKHLIRKEGINTIEVLVEDMGNVGGIYEGRIGIITRHDYERYIKR